MFLSSKPFINKYVNIKIKSGNKFDSNPHLLFIICHGHIAKNANPIIAIFLFVILLNSKYNTPRDIQPSIAIGNLIDNALNPRTFINGIIKYESNTFCPPPHDTRNDGSLFPFLSIP